MQFRLVSGFDIECRAGGLELSLRDCLQLGETIGIKGIMNKPRIAIPLPTSGDFAYNHRSWPQYAAGVERSGGEAVEIPLHLAPAGIADLINTCQGVLLP